MSRLVLEGISKIYGENENAVKALSDVSLEIAGGELVAVVGPSGSGKTTLLAIAGALLQPTEGRVSVDGQPLATLSPAALAKFRLSQIGFVLQSSNLVPYLSARDQLLLVAELAGKRNLKARQRADQLLNSVGLTERRNHYPEALSGGERQRVAIARALMNDPAIIIADEPTASLDSHRGREVVQMLAQEVKTGQKAGIMVTHDERMLDLCDRVIRIADGRIDSLLVA
jgi:putative ABC transport system ATP-binding protein